VTCVIDRRGRIRAMLTDEDGTLQVAGFKIASVDVPGDGMPLTFYTRHGDWFAWLCASSLFLLGVRRFRDIKS
jgi:apolipoprotein N-acyltransferase